MWPVPVTGQTLGVLLVGATLGARRGALALTGYAGLGLAGAPVFAGGAGGVAMLTAPSFGFVLGFIPAAALIGYLSERRWDRRPALAVAGFGLASLIPFLIGVPYMGAVLAALGLPHDCVMIDRTSSGDDHLSGPVVLRHKRRQVIAREGTDTLGRAEDGAAHRLIGVGDFLQPVEDHVIGRVQRLPDLLQDHAALDLYFPRVEHRVQDDIRDHIETEAHIGSQHPRVIGGHVARGVGVNVAAHILDRFGDLQRTARCRTFERHVFEEMGDAVLRGDLVAAARIHPDPNRC